MLPTTRNAALQALAQFADRAGADYAAVRNYDYGPEKRSNVSMLSPWIRVRLIPEWTVLQKVLDRHSPSAAAKFIDEVCWRTYWKGWLALRPSVWDDYCKQLAAESLDGAKREIYTATLCAQSGIDALDQWTHELQETGYLHNHARMWYASIWIHTLQLPWTLGAAFFLKHLLDGDAASNTLSWRWVAGLHTAGKAYLASAGNIEKFTAGRIKVSTPLASEPIPVDSAGAKPPAQTLPPLDERPSTGRTGLLVSEDDLSAHQWMRERTKIQTVAGMIPQKAYAAHGISEQVYQFRIECMRDALQAPDTLCTNVEAVLDWAVAAKLEYVCMAEPAVGIWNAVTASLRQTLKAQGIALITTRHSWDQHFYPAAQSGFFKFKKAIPEALQML